MNVRTGQIPGDLLPRQRNFACGPSLVRDEVAAGLARAPYTLTHRGPAYMAVQASATARMRALFRVPEDYTFLYVPGGATDCMDVLSWSLVTRRSAHYVSGNFSRLWSKVASRVIGTDGPPIVLSGEDGTHPNLEKVPNVDLLTVTLNETSTGVQVVPGALRGPGTLVGYDATSAAGGIDFDCREADAVFFSPQKCFGSPAGLAVLIVSPAALARRDEVAAQRSIPWTSDLALHAAKGVKDQTLNTPSALTLQAIADQAGWMLELGGMPAMEARCRESSQLLYDWAERSAFAHPFVGDPTHRSQTTVTIEIDPEVASASDLNAALAANGIIGTKAYRDIGQNQIRVATFPNLEPDSLRKLTSCLDWLLGS